MRVAARVLRRQHKTGLLQQHRHAVGPVRCHSLPKKATDRTARTEAIVRRCYETHEFRAVMDPENVQVIVYGPPSVPGKPAQVRPVCVYEVTFNEACSAGCGTFQGLQGAIDSMQVRMPR